MFEDSDCTKYAVGQYNKVYVRFNQTPDVNAQYGTGEKKLRLFYSAEDNPPYYADLFIDLGNGTDTPYTANGVYEFKNRDPRIMVTFSSETIFQ